MSGLPCYTDLEDTIAATGQSAVLEQLMGTAVLSCDISGSGSQIPSIRLQVVWRNHRKQFYGDLVHAGDTKQNMFQPAKVQKIKINLIYVQLY